MRKRSDGSSQTAGRIGRKRPAEDEHTLIPATTRSHPAENSDDEPESASARPPNSLTADPVYRIMHTLPRSDFLEIVKCRFGAAECVRAASYFDSDFMRNPLRHLRLQMGCDLPTGLHRFLPKIHHHRATLRLLDLARNDLHAADVAELSRLLELPQNTALEVLDLSFNRRIGNDGTHTLLHATRHNAHIRAILLRGVTCDDVGAAAIAPLLRGRPPPAPQDPAEGVTFQETTAQRPPMFFINLNQNRIGSAGTVMLGKGLPAHVSITLCRQCPPRTAAAPGKGM